MESQRRGNVSLSTSFAHSSHIEYRAYTATKMKTSMGQNPRKIALFPSFSVRERKSFHVLGHSILDVANTLRDVISINVSRKPALSIINSAKLRNA